MYLRKKRIFRFVFIAFIVCFFLAFGMRGSETRSNAEENRFVVQRIGQMISYAKNIFSIHAPEDGWFSVKIYDDVCVYRVIRERICKGITELSWDGCGYNEERLETKRYFFDFTLEGDSGNEYTYFFDSPVVGNSQHLQFVLPSGDTVYLSEPDDWFIEVKAVRNGTIRIDFLSEETENELKYFSEKTVHTGRIEHFSLRNIAGRKLPESGYYLVNVYEVSRPDEIYSFPLQIQSEDPQKPDVTVTGDIMPGRDEADDIIWQTMMLPSVVVDIEPQKHQIVFAEPDQKSETLGTLHGQTQALSVLEIREEWAKVGAWNHERAEYIEGWVPKNRLKVERPNPEYGLLVDKKNQTMTVFHQGKRIETLLISTGRMEQGKYDQETSAGSFLTGFHRVDFSTQGLKYDFVIQYDGGNLLHQIPYSSDGKKDFTKGRAYLGTKASHACIRIQADPGPLNGLNAYWLWTHLPYHTRIIILDDPDERESELSRLSGGPPTEKEWKSFAFSKVSDKGIILTFAGDIYAGSTEETFGNAAGFDAFFNRYGAKYPLEGLQEIFKNDDLTCVSLACVLKEDRWGENRYRTPRLRGLPGYSEMFSSGSIELISLGDDHLLDYSRQGYDKTSEVLGKVSAWAGENHPQVIRIQNHLFGFCTCREQDYLKDIGIIERGIRSLHDAGCEYVIVLCHWGNEKEEKHGKLQEAMARACARAGADLVIGYHPAHVQGIDEIDGMPVAYSLGRLISSGSFRPQTYDTLAVQAIFDPDQPDNQPKIILIPLLSSSLASENVNDFRPVPAGAEETDRIMKQIQKDTGFRIEHAGNR